MDSVKIVEFGPFRAMGIGRAINFNNAAENQECEFTALWERDLGARVNEIQRVENGGAFGISRCIPGTTDGTFEYIAAFEAKPDAPVPAGMMEVVLPRVHYAVFEVKNLSEIAAVWQDANARMQTLNGWEPYCGPKGCHCDQAVGFEYYPPTFQQDGKFQIYIPVKKI